MDIWIYFRIIRVIIISRSLRPMSFSPRSFETLLPPVERKGNFALEIERGVESFVLGTLSGCTHVLLMSFCLWKVRIQGGGGGGGARGKATSEIRKIKSNEKRFCNVINFFTEYVRCIILKW